MTRPCPLFLISEPTKGFSYGLSFFFFLTVKSLYNSTISQQRRDCEIDCGLKVWMSPIARILPTPCQ